MDDDASGIPANHAKKIKRILINLNVAEKPEDMKVSGWALHPLIGNRKGFWAVKVSGNWRITFRFDGRDAELVDYVDYH